MSLPADLSGNTLSLNITSKSRRLRDDITDQILQPPIEWPERSMFLLMLSFLTRYWKGEGSPTIVTVKVPHIAVSLLLNLFPSARWDFYDDDTTCPDLGPHVTVHKTSFNYDEARKYSGAYLISDSDNMDTQLNWYRLMNPSRALLRFSIDLDASTLYYLSGSLYLVPWGSDDEVTYLVPVGSNMVTWDAAVYDEWCQYHLQVERGLMTYKNIVNGEATPLDYPELMTDYDSMAEGTIIKEYLVRANIPVTIDAIIIISRKITLHLNACGPAKTLAERRNVDYVSLPDAFTVKPITEPIAPISMITPISLLPEVKVMERGGRVVSPRQSTVGKAIAIKENVVLPPNRGVVLVAPSVRIPSSIPSTITAVAPPTIPSTISAMPSMPSTTPAIAPHRVAAARIPTVQTGTTITAQEALASAPLTSGATSIAAPSVPVMPVSSTLVKPNLPSPMSPQLRPQVISQPKVGIHILDIPRLPSNTPISPQMTSTPIVIPQVPQQPSILAAPRFPLNTNTILSPSISVSQSQLPSIISVPSASAIPLSLPKFPSTSTPMASFPNVSSTTLTAPTQLKSSTSSMLPALSRTSTASTALPQLVSTSALPTLPSTSNVPFPRLPQVASISSARAPLALPKFPSSTPLPTSSAFALPSTSINAPLVMPRLPSGYTNPSQ